MVDDVEKAPLTTLGPVLETHEMFPERVNVEFIEILNDDEMNFRVWERGSGVTQACGTGACAAVVAAILNGKMERGKEITVHLAGGDLMIAWTEEGNVLMKGPAEVICRGVYGVQDRSVKMYNGLRTERKVYFMIEVTEQAAFQIKDMLKDAEDGEVCAPCCTRRRM